MVERSGSERCSETTWLELEPQFTPTIYLMFGSEGSGKSTQGRLLSGNLNIPFVGFGEQVRLFAKKNDPEVGQDCQKILNDGSFADNDLYTKIMKRIFGNVKDPESKFRKGVILDGAIRTLDQFKLFDSLMEEVGYSHYNVRGFELRIPLYKSYLRLLERGRPDDVPSIIEKRLKNSLSDAYAKGLEKKRLNIEKILCNNLSVDEVKSHIMKIIDCQNE